jgi:hypothetical protein
MEQTNHRNQKMSSKYKEKNSKYVEDLVIFLTLIKQTELKYRYCIFPVISKSYFAFFIIPYSHIIASRINLIDNSKSKV